MNKLLESSKADSDRVNIYYFLSDEFYDSDPHKSIMYANKGLTLSEKIGFESGSSICLNSIGLAYCQMGDFDSSLFFFKKRLKIVNRSGDKLGQANTYDNLGVIAIHFGKTDSALAFRKRANDIYIALNKKSLLAGGYNWIGNIYKEQGNYALALEYYLKSLKIYEDEKDLEKTAYPLLNMSSIYRYMKDYEKAKSYASEARLRFSEGNNENGVAVSLFRLSIIYSEEKDYDNSISNLLEAKEIFERVSNYYFLTSVNSLLGTCYLEKGNSDKAFIIFAKAAEMAASIGDLSLISSIDRNISNIYFKKNNFKKSLVYLITADSLSNLLKDNNAIKDNSTDFVSIYCKLNNPDSVLKYFHRYQTLSDTIFNEQNSKAIAEMQSKYESDKKDQQLLFQKTALKNKNAIVSISIAGSSLILALLVLTIILYWRKEMAYRYLVYQNLGIPVVKSKDESDNNHEENGIPYLTANGKGNHLVLDDEHKRQILDCLRKSLENKVFTEPNLTIKILAERCGTNRSYMSLVINEIHGMNYSAFINKLRIDEAVRILTDKEPEVPLKGLYQELGFNSYSVFNDAFKKFIGVTPAFFQRTARGIQTKTK